MKNTLLILFASLCMTVCMTVAQAQIVKYEEHATLDELRIDYRWQRERLLVRNSHAVLNLQLTNLSDAHLEVHFLVAFYQDGKIVFESDKNTLCFRPGQRLRGGRAGLRFMADDVFREDVEKEGFDWDILISEINEVSSCE